MKRFIFLGFILILLHPMLIAQDDLMDMLDDEEETVDYAYATFKTTRIINSHNIENPATGVLLFMIQHRFGKINSGWYELFGLDEASIRFGYSSSQFP